MNLAAEQSRGSWRPEPQDSDLSIIVLEKECGASSKKLVRGVRGGWGLRQRLAFGRAKKKGECMWERVVAMAVGKRCRSPETGWTAALRLTW